MCAAHHVNAMRTSMQRERYRRAKTNAAASVANASDGARVENERQIFEDVVLATEAARTANGHATPTPTLTPVSIHERQPYVSPYLVTIDTSSMEDAS
jgi:hypothetical protein